MTLLWRIPDHYPEELIGVFEKSSFDRFLFKQGRRIMDLADKPIVKFSARSNQLNRYSCLPNSGQIPLISRQLTEALEKLRAGDFQAVPAKIYTGDGEIGGFSFLNVTSCVNAIDHANSVYSMVPGTKQIMGFKQLRHAEGCLGQSHLALDVEYRHHLLVSTSVRDLLKLLNAEGVELKMAEEIMW